MIDRFFTAALTFCLLAAGTLAIGSAFFEGSKTAPQVVQLPAVEMHIVQLPRVEVSGKRVVDATTAVARTERTEPATRATQ